MVEVGPLALKATAAGQLGRPGASCGSKYPSPSILPSKLCLAGDPYGFPASCDTEEKIALAGTIQFGPAVHAAKVALGAHFANVLVPQAKPISGGEVLSCLVDLST
ncbi:hypothetical protein GOP47_0011856 [Adiantum capillus-veneris]|uniref:Uncharacterized protein n=1 Tax=Adiantum capillus-veneris TaxID=13818 RepID=A0A9D4UTJ8_ADICA|nr:hypothetical protein GOP47_0011856 [Adiantum capillus-veneris]